VHAEWLVIVAWIGIAIGGASALVIALDIAAGHRQRMWIMNLVWPLTALYAGLAGLWAYYAVGRTMTQQAGRVDAATDGKRRGEERSLAAAAALGATHCGSGCTLGDLVAEWFVVLVPLTLFGRAIFGTWALDFVLAFLFGIAFQYFTITPMRHLSVADGLKAALKADTASLIAWQLGMYGWMALVTFVIFGHELEKTSPVFWFMMQIAMAAGFFTSWPVNAWLVRRGWKEKM
jgi:hypothetical protein